MSPTVVEMLIRAVVTVGTEAVVAIMHAVSAGDVSAVKALAGVMPDAHRLALEDEAVRLQARALAHAADVTAKVVAQ